MATPSLLGLTLTLSPTALTALRLAPLISSTASLTHAYMEYLTNSAFLGPAPVDSSLSRFLIGSDASASSQTASSQPLSSESPTQAAQAAQAARVSEAKQIVLPHWFTTFFNTAIRSVIGLNSLTLLGASFNLRLADGLGDSKILYRIGLVSALAHYAFVPLVGRSVRALIGMAAGRKEEEREEEKGEEKEKEAKNAEDWVKEWIGWHKVRMGTVDVLAWGSFACGAVGALTV